MKHRQTKHLAVCVVLLGAALTVLVWFSLRDRLLSASYMEPVRHLSGVTMQIDGGEPEAVVLPAKLDRLAPRTPVALTAAAEVRPGDSLLIKSVFAPLRLYIDGVLAYECGQEGSYPPYMNDPPTILATVPLPDKEGTVSLRIEYLSPTQRSTLSLPPLAVGNEAALLADQFRENGFSLLFSLILIFIGLAMVLVSLTIVSRVSSGFSFLWLGLFSLSAGIWVLGECDLTAFLLPYPSLLYTMAYVGLFTVTIPFLNFGLVVLNPKSRLPFRILLVVHYVSVAAALTLQLSGLMDFTRSLYWFHIIAPLGFVVFAGCLVWEHFRYRNPAAGRFAPAVILLAASTVLEVLNYWLRLTDVLTVFFQLGALAFVIALGLVSGYYVRESVRTAAEKARLEYEMAAAARQLELQRLQYQKMAENDAAVKAQRHDLRHQLTVLREMNARGDSQKLGVYIDTLLGNIPSDKDIRLCENYAVNAVAAYYAAAARNEGIESSLQFALPGELDDTVESDLCIIVGNLLENAVEACRRMENGARFIRLNSRLEYGTLTITADNSFNGNIWEKDGVFLSSKREGEGVGLSSVAAVAKKYGGRARFEAKDGVFQASVYVRLGDDIW
ncbi:MAG TPA: hypothetical protein DEA44_16985 [Firmicutes bacterium]|jgi:signal transduction histidine kinase|nr:hypothetical protein [Bacillota bacterium]